MIKGEKMETKKWWEFESFHKLFNYTAGMLEIEPFYTNSGKQNKYMDTFPDYLRQMMYIYTNLSAHYKKKQKDEFERLFKELKRLREEAE